MPFRNRWAGVPAHSCETGVRAGGKIAAVPGGSPSSSIYLSRRLGRLENALIWGANSANPQETRNTEPFSAWLARGMHRKSSGRLPASAEREPGRLAHRDITPRRDLQLCPSRISPAPRHDAIRWHRIHFRAHRFFMANPRGRGAHMSPEGGTGGHGR